MPEVATMISSGTQYTLRQPDGTLLVGYKLGDFQCSSREVAKMLREGRCPEGTTMAEWMILSDGMTVNYPYIPLHTTSALRCK